MRLYYMTDLRVAQIILRERRMKLSLFHELNDPFELLGVSLGEKKIRELFKVVRKHFEESFGILCFTSHWKSPVMWAHYGDKHYGACLGFDIPDGLVKKVSYQPERLQHTAIQNDPLLGLDEEKLEILMSTKYGGWSYEREYRLFSGLKDKDPETGFYYVGFNQDMVLAEVILGARCTVSVLDMSKELVSPDQPVTFSKARAGFMKYEMVPNRSISPLTV